MAVRWVERVTKCEPGTRIGPFTPPIWATVAPRMSTLLLSGAVKRLPQRIVMFALGLALMLALAGPAQAAKRRAPFGLFGVVFDPQQAGAVSDSVLNAQMALMARSGVESVRIPFGWDTMEPAQNVYQWAATDRLVLAAASHGIQLLPNINYTPAWASDHPTSPISYRYQPRSVQTFADFMTQVVKRYGPNGSFWTNHPGRHFAVREWQIWNEEAFNIFWGSTPWQKTYTKLLKAGYVAIHRADRGAKVVAGSFAAITNYNQWQQVSDFYKAGAKHYFDVISVHPFTIDPNSVSNSVKRMLTIVSNVRAVMRRNGDGRKPIILTELSWPAAIPAVPVVHRLGLETTARGEQQRLAAAYQYLGDHYKATGITQAYWFEWATSFDPNIPRSDVSFEFAGLNKFANGVFSARPVLTTYANVAAHFEGCRKSSSGNCR
jgi:Cellulase (glycosyl hydrolase family 5)